jgi:hypothetical protein
LAEPRGLCRRSLARQRRVPLEYLNSSPCWGVGPSRFTHTGKPTRPCKKINVTMEQFFSARFRRNRIHMKSAVIHRSNFIHLSSPPPLCAPLPPILSLLKLQPADRERCLNPVAKRIPNEKPRHPTELKKRTRRSETGEESFWHIRAGILENQESNRSRRVQGQCWEPAVTH